MCRIAIPVAESLADDALSLVSMLKNLQRQRVYLEAEIRLLKPEVWLLKLESFGQNPQSSHRGPLKHCEQWHCCYAAAVATTFGDRQPGARGLMIDLPNS